MNKELKKKIFDLMIKSRVLEERLIKMNKAGMGFFWLGGPGEEAFNVPLGLLIRKGSGLDYDYLHFHYRQSATMLAMGEEMIGSIRQMHNTITDPYSGGRNFVGHFSKKEWNVVPGSSAIEVQHLAAIGTAEAQRRNKSKGITIVTGGDAGTAEGDFASCLVWASRQKKLLPILIIVTNNNWGISTPYCEVHNKQPIAKRGDGFGIKNAVVNGNDVEASYKAIQNAMDYVRNKRQPFLLEARVSRLYGHSSASGANRANEEDCIPKFEKKLLKEKIIQKGTASEIFEKYDKESRGALQETLGEPKPRPESIFDHVFAERESAMEPTPRWFKR